MLEPNALVVEVGTLQTVSPEPLKVKVRLDVMAFHVPLDPENVSVFPLTMLFVSVLLAEVFVKVQAPVNAKL